MGTNPNSILRRKIAAVESRRAAQLLPVDRMSEAIAGVLESYFLLKLKPPALLARVIEPKRFASYAGERAWYLFRAGAADIVISFDFALTIAATNMAIGRKFSDIEEAKPALADRAISAGLAQRVAAAISSVKELPFSLPTFVQSAWSIEDIKIDRGGPRFEWYDAGDIPLTGSFQVSLACGVSVDNAHSDGHLKASDKVWEERLLDIALGTDVRLGANLGLVHTDFGSLVDLAPGATLPVAAFNRDNVPMTVRGSATPILSGKVGGQKGFKAIRIQALAFG